MARKRTVATALAAVALAVGGAAGAAISDTGGGPAPNLDFATGDRVDTPSASFQQLIAKAFSSERGAMVVRLSAEGCVQDTNGQGRFVGRAYAAMQVRALLNGVPLAPGTITLLDNAGKIGEPCGLGGQRASAASFEWGGAVTTAGPQTVTVQFRNVRAWDSATVLHSTLVIQHG
jgi:hypothetical protein